MVMPTITENEVIGERLHFTATPNKEPTLTARNETTQLFGAFELEGIFRASK